MSCASEYFNFHNFGLVCQEYDEIPDHHEVETNEESQRSPAVRDKGGEGGGLLLNLHLYVATTEHDPQARQVRGTLISERTV